MYTLLTKLDLRFDYLLYARIRLESEVRFCLPHFAYPRFSAEKNEVWQVQVAYCHKMKMATEYYWPHASHSLPVNFTERGMLGISGGPDLELGGGGGGAGAVLIYLPCRPFSLQSFLLFLLKIRGGPGPPGPSPRSASECRFCFLYRTTGSNHWYE